MALFQALVFQILRITVEALDLLVAVVHPWLGCFQTSQQYNTCVPWWIRYYRLLVTPWGTQVPALCFGFSWPLYSLGIKLRNAGYRRSYIGGWLTFFMLVSAPPVGGSITQWLKNSRVPQWTLGKKKTFLQCAKIWFHIWRMVMSLIYILYLGSGNVIPVILHFISGEVWCHSCSLVCAAFVPLSD